MNLHPVNPNIPIGDRVIFVVDEAQVIIVLEEVETPWKWVDGFLRLDIKRVN